MKYKIKLSKYLEVLEIHFDKIVERAHLIQYTENISSRRTGDCNIIDKPARLVLLFSWHVKFHNSTTGEP